MNLFKYIILITILLIARGCKPGSSEKKQSLSSRANVSNLSGNFSVSGAYALHPLVQKWADDFMKIHPGVKIEVIKTGSGQGLTDLLAGRNQLAMISRPLTDEELSIGLWTIPVAKDGVAPIVNQKNPYLHQIMKRGLNPEKYIRIFTSNKSLTWGELLDTTGKEPVVVYTRADLSGAADVWADFLFKKSADLKGIKVTGDEEMIRSIQENPFAIGYCNFSYAFDPATGERIRDIQVIPFDLDFDNIIDGKEVPYSNLEKAHRGLWLGIYPKNLCRELTIGSLGKPTDPSTQEFLRYILSEGQAEIKKTGLCELNNVYIRDALSRLK
jgi:phosphate transport system substrate-binding protein